MLNFEFLQEGWTEWIHIYKSAMSAIIYTESDPLVASMYARRALEIAIKWIYKNDSELSSTSWFKDSTLHELISLEKFQSFVDPIILMKCQAITKLGNRAIHELEPIEPVEVETIIIYLYEVCLWLANTYPTSPYKGNKFSKEYIAALLSELQISRSVKPRSFKNQGIKDQTKNTISNLTDNLNYSDQEKELLSLSITKAVEEAFYRTQMSIVKYYASMGKRIINQKYVEVLENFKQAVNSSLQENIIENFIQKNRTNIRRITIKDFIKYKEDILLELRQKLNECEASFAKILAEENFIMKPQLEPIETKKVQSPLNKTLLHEHSDLLMSPPSESTNDRTFTKLDTEVNNLTEVLNKSVPINLNMRLTDNEKSVVSEVLSPPKLANTDVHTSSRSILQYKPPSENEDLHNSFSTNLQNEFLSEKIRVFELAQKLGIDIQKTMKLCKVANIFVKSHSSSITKSQAKIIQTLLEIDISVQDKN